MWDTDEEEDLVIRNTNGEIVFRFNTPEAKESFEKILLNMHERDALITGEGYVCGHCAAYPCFRQCTPVLYRFTKEQKGRLTEEERAKWLKIILDEASIPAGLCFQPVRGCRQECPNYNYHKNFPAGGGRCRSDGYLVDYE